MGTKPHLLVVDDSITIRIDLRATLGGAGFMLTTCDTVASARRALRTHRFAAVILDVQLPDGSGIDLLRHIREAPELNVMPVLLLTTRAEVENRIEGIIKGADEYIGKPFDREYLVTRLWKAVGTVESFTATPRPRSFGKKILVADDCATFRQVTANELRRDGHDVVLAHSGEEALRLLEIEPVDCVMLDFIMGDLNGIELCHRIRRLPGREGTPVMLMTAHDDPVVRVHALAAGVDALVLKSPEVGAIRAELRALLERRHAGLAGQAAPAHGAPPSSRSRGATALLGQVVAASGLSMVIAHGALERACRRVGVDARTMTGAELRRALPSIQESLRTFLPEEEAEQRIRSIGALARLASRTS